MARDRPLRLRFAPSPTGSLHLGNARTALFNWALARQSGGRFVLRIEDTDVERRAPGAEQGILEDLAWLGLDWDEGPDVGGEFGPYRQSERGELYARAAERLLESGDAYRCFCDPAELAAERERRRAAGLPPHYGGRCRDVPPDRSAARAAAGEPHAIRFRIAGPGDPAQRLVFRDGLRGPVEVELGQLGDPVIVRRDGRPTYNFAVVVDDAAMRIDRVVRGDDHLSNTPRQLLVFRALGHDVPEWVHLPMVRGEDGQRLSKRHGAMSLAEYRLDGYPADGMVNALALLGWSPGADRTIVDRDELVREFDLRRVGRSAATFDRAKLEWICSRHVQSYTPDRLRAAVGEQLVAAGRVPRDLDPEADAWLREVAELLRPLLSHFGEVPERSAGVFARGGGPSSAEARDALLEEQAADVVRVLARQAAEHPPLDLEAWRTLHTEVRRLSGARGRALFRPIRVALTGESSGPELDRLVPLIARGARLLPGHVAAVAARAERTALWLGERG